MFVWQTASLGVSGRDALRYLLAPCPWGAAGGTPETFFSMGLAGAEHPEAGRGHRLSPVGAAVGTGQIPPGSSPPLAGKASCRVNPLWPKRFISQNLGTA